MDYFYSWIKYVMHAQINLLVQSSFKQTYEICQIYFLSMRNNFPIVYNSVPNIPPKCIVQSLFLVWIYSNYLARVKKQRTHGKLSHWNAFFSLLNAIYADVLSTTNKFSCLTSIIFDFSTFCNLWYHFRGLFSKVSQFMTNNGELFVISVKDGILKRSTQVDSNKNPMRRPTAMCESIWMIEQEGAQYLHLVNSDNSDTRDVLLGKFISPIHIWLYLQVKHFGFMEKNILQKWPNPDCRRWKKFTDWRSVSYSATYTHDKAWQ